MLLYIYKIMKKGVKLEKVKLSRVFKTSKNKNNLN